jgi:hypothetical protein
MEQAGQKKSITEIYTVKSIDTFQTKEWCLKKHYAKRLPPVTHSFGLFDYHNKLQGVATYGTPVSSTLRNLWHNKYKLMELNRLVINEGLHKNVLSFFLSQSLLKMPKPLVIVSYADTSKNHHGYIYQATNWIYTGLSIPFKDIAIKGLENQHHTTIEDLVRGKENRIDALKEMFGDRLYYVDRAQKHRYFYFIGCKNDKKEMIKMIPYKILPYPKGENKRYDASYKPTVQTQLF